MRAQVLCQDPNQYGVASMALEDGVCFVSENMQRLQHQEYWPEGSATFFPPLGFWLPTSPTLSLSSVEVGEGVLQG